MKAIICDKFGAVDTLRYGDWPDPEIQADEILIRPDAIGVNFPDGLLVQGLYQLKPELPFVPGMEAAGSIISVGKDVTDFAIGDRVACLSTLGAYAEKVACKAKTAMPLPDPVSAADACALLCGYGTAHHALKQRAQLKCGETVAIAGASGLTGLAAVQIAKAMGARVIAIASSDEKRTVARQNGADETFGYEDLRNDLKSVENGIDVFFDPVGGQTFETGLRSLKRNGRALVIGFAEGGIPKVATNLVLVKELAIIGVFWGNFIRYESGVYQSNMAELFNWLSQGKVQPHIGGSAPLSDAPNVLQTILNRGAIGKHVLIP